MSFCFPKARGGVGGCRMPFVFRQQWGLSLFGRQDGSPSDQPADGGVYPCHFPGGLVEGWKSVELLNLICNNLIYYKIHSKQSLNKSVLFNKRMRKEKMRSEWYAVASSFHQPLCVVGGLLRLHILIYQYFITLIQQFNRISKLFQQFFRDGIIPAHTSSGLVTVIAAVLVGGVGKTVGCRCQLPALLHHFPYLRFLHPDLRAD